MTRFPAGLGAIVDGIDIIVMDLWGCMHDGITVYPAALEALHRLKEKGVAVALVSNAPRRVETVRPRLRDMGIGDHLYSGFYTSGEMIWNHLADRALPDYAALGRRCYQIVGGQDLTFTSGLGLETVAHIDQADFLLVIGVDSPNDRVEDFDGVLNAAKARNLPLICCNPDLIVHRGNVAEICAGAIADHYAAMGGKVLIEGKPHPGIYAKVLKDFNVSDPQRLMGVGDALRTDVTGAKGIGARSLLIAGGIHHAVLLQGTAVDQAALKQLAAGGPQPDYCLPYLVW